MPVSVFHHDNGGIHQNSNGQCQPTKRHDVGTDVEVVHWDEGDCERDRQGENRDQRRAEVEQENNNDQGNYDGFLDQTVFQSVDRFADQTAAVIAGDHFNSRRQRSFDLRQLFLHTINYVKGVETIAHDHNAAHGLAFSIPLGYAFTDVGAEGNRAEIFDEYRRSVLGHHGHIRQIIQRFQVAQPANHVSRAAQFEHSSTHFIRARLHPVDHCGKRNAYASNLLGSTLTWYCRTNPPMLATSATP